MAIIKEQHNVIIPNMKRQAYNATEEKKSVLSLAWETAVIQLISSISRWSQYTIVLCKMGNQRHSWVSGEVLHSYPKEAQNRHTNIKTEDYTGNDNNSIQMKPPSQEKISLRTKNPHLEGDCSNRDKQIRQPTSISHKKQEGEI